LGFGFGVMGFGGWVFAPPPQPPLPNPQSPIELNNKTVKII